MGVIEADMTCRLPQGKTVRWPRVCALMLVLAGLSGQQAPAAEKNGIPSNSAQVSGAHRSDYQLGAGDAIRILVYQNPDLSLEARLSEGGVLSYPLLGTLKLDGKSPREAELLIEQGLREGQFLRSPQVSVVVTQVRGHQASVLGQVLRPGRFPIETPGMRLSALLAQAGGITPNGSERVTLIGQRQGSPVRWEVEVPLIFDESAPEKDPPVQGGDVIYVDRAPLVYIYGEVQRPGAMRLERSMTVQQALAAGGGPTLRGTERGLRVLRKTPQGQPITLHPSPQDILLPGDVIHVQPSLF